MSRRKQAKPRALKREDVDNLPDESTEDIDMQDINKINLDDKDISNTMEFDSNSGMDGTSLGTATPNISMTDLENSQESELNGGVSTTSSLSTDDPSDGDGDLPFTVGVTDSTPYPCHFCDKAFPRQSYLKQHEQEHSKELIFLCQYCKKSFKHKRSRDRHIKLHTGDRRYKCTSESCDMAFSRSDHLKIHLKTHGNGKPFPCKTCTRGYNTEAALTAHKQTHKKGRGARHHPDKHFKCLTCNALFAQSHQLQDHMVTHQNDGDASERTVHCNFCAENFSTPEQLRQHVDQNHVPDTQGRCHICFQTFENLEDLMQHKKVHEISHKDHTQSPPVRDSSKSPQALPKHKVSNRIDATSDSDAPPPKIRRLSKPRDSSSPFSNPRTTPEESTPFACEFCTKRFVDMRELQRHTLHNHSHFDAYGNSSVYCTLCNFSFTNSYSFMEHVRQRHEDATDRRPKNSSRNSSPRLGPEPFNGAANLSLFQCNQCNTGFFHFEQFRHHMQGHFIVGPNDFLCHVCGEKSPSKSHHVAHIADHFRDPVTEFRCQGCGMKFANPDQLQKHLLELHSLQLFRCSVCNLEFQSKGEINVHFAVKHSNTSCVFRCKTCQVVSRNELEFQLHVKTMHMVQDLTYHCPLCSQSFPSEPELYVHFQMHRAFNCLYCSETFQLQFLLDRHVQEKHSASGTASFPREDVAQNLSLKGSPGKRQAHNLRPSASQKSGQTALSLDCAYCPESCKSRTELENHMKSHRVSSSKHKCNICDELFPSAATLSEHKLSHLKVETHRSCVVCHVSLESAEQFEAHLRQHNADGMPAPCVICRQTLMTEEDVQVHARHHLKVQDMCSCCRKTIPAQMMIINGTQDNHSFMCKDCFHSSERADRFDESSLKFENSPELSNHKMTAHPQKLFNCIKCQLTFDSKEEVENHCQIHILQEGNDNKCRLCDKNFDSPSKLQCHLIEHSFQESSNYRCYLCNAVFTGPCLIQQHMLEHNSKDKPFRCEQCHLSFFFKAELDNHIPSHSDLSGNVTSDIAQTLTTQNSFPAHSKIHDKPNMYVPPPYVGLQTLRTLQPPPPCSLPTPITFFPGLYRKPLPCRTCSKVYYSKESLARHVKRHLSFPCRYCEKRFAKEEEVTEHMRLHITSTTSPCEMCPETFESTSQLKEHLVAAHGKRFDHCCTVCSEAFESSELLKRHVHKEHRESPSPETSESLSSDTKDSCSSNLEESGSSPLSVDANLETTHAVSQTVA